MSSPNPFVHRSPLQAGYHIPAQWAPHEQCWMAWPHRTDLWSDLPATKMAYAEVARVIRRFEPVAMVAHPDAPAYRSPLVVEGGALHVDREGTVITTDTVIFDNNRNPGLSRAEAEKELCHARRRKSHMAAGRPGCVRDRRSR